MAPKGKSKSIWRDPSAQHFQVVHRSQRDPLINDSEAGSHVLKQFTPKHSNTNPSSSSSQSNGNTLSDLKQELQAEGVKERPNVGQASLYGVYYDDTQYDYMQHLRPIGGNYHSQRGGKDEENDVSAILLEAPQKGKNQKDKGKARAQDQVEAENDNSQMQGFKLKDSTNKEQMQLPDDVLPNKKELTLEQSRRNQLNIDPDLQGLQPDMDPHLRQVLEALDDEAFDFEKARNNLKKSKAHQKSLEARAMQQTSAMGKDREAEISQQDEVKAEGQNDQEDEEEEEEEDFDDFLAGIIQEGEQDENDQEPEWKALPPGGEESIWLDAGERALFKSKSIELGSRDEDQETVGIQQDESIPDIPQGDGFVGGQGAGVDDEGISLSARIALFKKAQKLESQLQKASSPTQEPEGSSRASGLAASRAAPSIAGSQTSIFSDTKKKSRPGTKARLGASSMAGSQNGDGASAWSMSSSAMFRNEGLKGLDDRFDRLEQLYEEEEEDSSPEDGDDDFPSDEEDPSSLPPPPSREDLDTILDDFLDKYELLGGKMKPLLGSKDSTPAEKLSLLRKELGEARIGGKEWKVGEGMQYIRKNDGQDEDEDDDDDDESEDETPLPMPRMVGENREKWDVETVLSTRTNTENHPTILPLGSSIAGGSTTSNRPVSIAASSYLAGSIAGSRLTASGAERMPKVKVDPRTGLTQIIGWEKPQKRRDGAIGEGSVTGENDEVEQEVVGEHEDDEDYDSDVTEGPRNVTITRPRNEDKDEKKARKAAAKEEKQARRQAKSNMKAAFAEERKRLNQSEIQRTRDGGAADIGRNGIRMRGGATAIRLS